MDLHHLLEAAGIVVASVLFYSLAYVWFQPDDPRRRPLWVAVLGLAWGGIAVVLMISRSETSEGVSVDGGVIPVAVIGLLEGWGAGLLAALPAVAYRVWLGGSGAVAGVVTVLAVAVAAGLTHRWAGGTTKVRIHHAVALAAAAFLITFGGFGLLGERGRALFARVWPWYLALTVIGLPAVAILMETIVERRALAQERERFHAVLDHATDAIRIVDADTHAILDCNRADCELSGLSREQMLGRDSRLFWPSPAADPLRQRPTGLPSTQTALFQSAAGRVLPVDCARRIVEYRHHRYEIVIFRDAAERLAGEEARREAASLRSVNLLAQAAAHEINNPLGIILGYVQMLEDRLPPGTEESHWAHNCRNAAARIGDAVARLSRIVRVEGTPPTGSRPGVSDTKRSPEKLRDDSGG